MNAGESLSTPAQLVALLSLCLSLYFPSVADARPPFSSPFVSTRGSDGLQNVFPWQRGDCVRTNGIGQMTPHILYYVISPSQGSYSRYSLPRSRFTFAHFRLLRVSFHTPLIAKRRFPVVLTTLPSTRF